MNITYLCQLSLRFPDRFEPHSRFPGLFLAQNYIGRELGSEKTGKSRSDRKNLILFRGRISWGLWLWPAMVEVVSKSILNTTVPFIHLLYVNKQNGYLFFYRIRLLRAY
jgi:hypothetical protein